MMLSGFTSLALLLFSLRRWLFLLIAVLRRSASSLPPSVGDWPAVLLLVPVRNEAAVLPNLLASLRALCYPADRLTIVLIDDGSTDGSDAMCRAAAVAEPHWHYLRLSTTVGKAAALNAALTRFPQGELVIVYDADEQPSPDALQQLTRPFADGRVGAVSGRRAVSNPLATAVATYATYENLVHQLVTLAAKERLALAPPLLGSNCAYRRAALTAVGGFRPGALLEDSDLTLRLALAGWQTRFEVGAVSTHAVPRTLAGYWRQHRRWARGFNAVARDHLSALLRAGRLPWPLRLELVAFVLGYLDRLALLAAVGLLIISPYLGRRPSSWLLRIVGLHLLTPFIQVIVALHLSRAPWPLWRRIIYLPPLLVLDIAASVAAAGQSLYHTMPTWELRER